MKANKRMCEMHLDAGEPDIAVKVSVSHSGLKVSESEEKGEGEEKLWNIIELEYKPSLF